MRLLLPLVFLLCVNAARAQTGTVRGFVYADIDNNGYINGATVRLINSTDTLNTVCYDGSFYLERVPYGDFTLIINHVSYEPKVVLATLDKKVLHLSVPMKEATTHIKQVGIKGKVPLMTQRGDTLIYHAAAIKTLEGDHTIDLIKQMPGVVINDGSITVLGETITRTYVDDKLTFGTDPMAALNNLLANDIIKISVYDEASNRSNKTKFRKGDKRERVLNIETKSKLLGSTNIHFLASYGADIGTTARDSKDRYGIGTTAYMFTEKLQLNLNAYSNNTDRSSNRMDDLLNSQPQNGSYNRSSMIDAHAARSWKTKTEEHGYVDISYLYNNNQKQSRSVVQQIYFPTAEYDSRLYADTTRSKAVMDNHMNNLVAMFPNIASGVLFFSHNIKFNNATQNSSQANSTQLNGSQPVGSRTSSNSKDKSYSINESLDWRMQTNDRLLFAVNGSFSSSNGGTDGLRIDSLSSTINRKVVESSGNNHNKQYSTSATMIYKFSNEIRNDLSLSYYYNYENNVTRKTSLNMSDPLDSFTDTTSTYNFTNNHNTQNISLNWNVHIPKLKSDLRVGAKYNTSKVFREEEFPETQNYDKRYHAFLPEASFATRGMKSRFYVYYSTGVDLPSVEQLRDKINDINPYMLVAGNSKLKQSYRHSLSANYNYVIGKQNGVLEITGRFMYMRNPVASKTEFFTEDTVLSDHGSYVAPAQSSLLTYENVGSRKDGMLRASYSQPLGFIKSQITTGLSYQWEQSSNYISESLNTTNTHMPTLNVALQTNFSKIFRVNIGGSSAYAHSSNTHSDKDQYIRSRVHTKVEMNNILKRIYLHSSYNAMFYNRLNSSMPNTTQHILNVALGCKVLKRKGDISITAYDLLNRNSSFSTSMMSDYIRNQWRDSFGRYFSVNVGYYFNKSKN